MKPFSNPRKPQWTKFSVDRIRVVASGIWGLRPGSIGRLPAALQQACKLTANCRQI